MTVRTSRFHVAGADARLRTTLHAIVRRAKPLALPAAVLLASLLVPGLALAGDYARSGFYVGGGASYASDIYEDEIEDAIDVRVDIEDTWGANARGGLRLGRYAAIEIQYEWLDTYEIEVKNVGGTAKIDQQTLTANLKLYLPIGRFQPYLIGGIGYQRFEVDATLFAGFVPSVKRDQTSLAGRLGAGLDVYLTDSVALFVEGGVVLTDEELNLPAPAGLTGDFDVENLFYAGAQAGLLFRF